MITPQDSLLATAGAAIIVHLIFNRFEPRALTFLFILLVAVPIALIAILYPSFTSLSNAVLLIYPTFIASLLASLIIYRLSPLHPLAKFPGPVINRLSNMWMMKVAVTGKRHIYIKNLHDKYGPIVRVGPNYLSVADVDAIYPVLSAKGMPRTEAHQMFLMDKSNTNLTSELDPAKHAEIRKAWHHGFTPDALKGYEEIIARRGSQLLDRLGQQSGVLDLGKWISYYKFDFMGDITFGGGFEMMKAGGDLDGLWDLMQEGMRIASIVHSIPWISSFLKLLPVAPETFRVMAFSRERVEIRSRTGSSTHDLFYHFSQEGRPDEERPSLERLAHDAGLAIIAASDTTSLIITGLLYHMLCNPQVFHRLQKEVDSFFDHDEEINDYNKLTEMPYLNACINETLRLMPPLPVQLQRYSSVGTLVCGRFIPKGTFIFISLYALLRDSRYFFPNPDAFWPERWLTSELEMNSEKSEIPTNTPFVHNTDAFIPFSFGPANCIGKRLAYMEMRAVIASILQKYEIRFADEYDPNKFIEELKDEGVFLKGALPVLLTKRS